MGTVVVIDRSSSVPLSRQIYDFWRLGILSGRFAGGERVPSTRDLAVALDLSRGTITQAYEQLISEGYFQTAHGSGTFVCRQLPERLLNAPAVTGRRPTHDASAPLSTFGKRLQQDYQHLGMRAGYICLSHWGPDLNLFPLDSWHRLYARSLRTLGSDALGYAEYARGYEPLCEEIAKYVSRSRAVTCSADQVIVVNGSQQGLDLCARLLLEPGDEVAVENPGYSGASRVFEATGARLRPVPVDREGIVCTRLGETAKVAYVTPAHQFPTGVALSLRRRLELIGWARQRRAVIIEDDYDSEYRFESRPVASLQGQDEDGRVLYIGTFSKVLFPSLRLGYMVAPRDLVSAFAAARDATDIFSSVLYQAAMTDFIREGHFARHLRRMRMLYMERREALAGAIRAQMGDVLEVVGAEAGMHFVALLPAGADDVAIAMEAARRGVSVIPLSSCYLRPPARGGLILGFGGAPGAQLASAVRTLRQCVAAG
jgi:GntR family transcriptional regulator / MocR family aminotransferase